MAKPRLALILIPLIFLSSSLVHPMPCTSSSLSYTCTTIHRFPISPSVPESLGTCFSLSFSIQSWWNNQNSFITHHSKLSPTISHPSLQNYPLTSPSFRFYLNSIPIYPILYTFLWNPPTSQAEGSLMTWPTLPTILPLLILTPSKTSPFIRISFSFSLSFLSFSACFLVRSGEIKMSLKFSEFESFRDPETTLHLTATDSIFKLTCRFLPMSAISLSSTPLFLNPPILHPSPDTASKSQVPS